MADELTRERIAELDSAGELADILAVPDHLRDAIWRVESAVIEPRDTPRGLVVAGMGGSAIGGDLARAALGDSASRPIGVARGYALPSWTTGDTTVLCASYSGETEETLAAFEGAGVIGARRVVVTTGGALARAARAEGVPVIGVPGGMQPRAAVAYMLVAALEVAALCGAAPGVRAELDAAAARAEELVADWGPDADEGSLAKSTARALLDTIPVIVGAGPTTAAAYRWKTQINENAEMHAFASELPEVDHNEIVGWGDAGGRFSAVFLDDVDLHPHIRRRIDLTRELIAPDAATTLSIGLEDAERTVRLVGLVLLGDLVSLYLAILRRRDPTRVEVIERLKTELAREYGRV